MIRCYLFDIDGTVADCQHRIHHIEGGKQDWRAFFAGCKDDAPIPHIIELAQKLMVTTPIIFVSGRSDECRYETALWLGRHGFSFMGDDYTRLLMRKAGDHRPDNVVKGELLDQIRANGYEPIMAFDDRDQVVKMWREKGIPCAQVAPGNF